MSALRQTVRILVLFALAIPPTATAQSHTADDERIFAQYVVPEVFKGKPAPVDLSSQGARAFRTRLREAARSGTAFAGHYGVAAWGCGTICIAFSIVDLKTGKVSFFPATIQHTANGVDLLVGEAVDCRPNSGAVHIIGALNEQDNAADRWYVWTGLQFKLIRTVPAQTAPNDQQ